MKVRFAIALAVLLFVSVRIHVQAAEQEKVIPIVAKRFAFTPDHVVLKKGEPVILRLTSEDVTHGFFVRPLKVDELIEPGKTVDVKVTPEQTGTFSVICHHFCGAGHGNMKMSITVE
jgi:cytochrome c oxidase subunit 2